ncbi:ABC transporter substrate-binding protein [Paenibacillus sp. GCM10023248]|uniref:SgrR family transcriptional regulator n=1 Tax=Bacillales TaxID=1385 RepID=UPI002378989F|nr:MULTISPECIES: SgrR family transcriptional regulator [Bacillales]MDD9267255.1 ABC transporter substrate-binding protein [Paenibacillus sp. MAHUQ-63]MDR6881469.1 MarR-like DNA-binding transcriptional regulator SgrR of sgrS sRNA [Bacillus sp. 3255]
MLVAERYLALYDRFGGENANGEPVEASLEELADALYCTPRNAKLVLKKLEEDDLIDWLPGRGRGNRSHIAFKIGKESFLLSLATSRAADGDYRTSFEVLGTYGEGTEAKIKFIEWLKGTFGYQKESVEGHIECDTLRFPVYRSVQTLDPGKVNYAFDSHIIRQIFDRLVTYDETVHRIVPGAAHAWNADAQAMEWTFYLRKGVLFHSGRELTSQDVVFTFERLRSLTMPNRWMMRNLQLVEATGPRTVRFVLAQPNRIFDRFLCAAAASILPLDLGGLREDDYWRLPSGTGPFQLESFSPHRIKLGAHTSYYAGRPYLDGVDIIIMPEDCREMSTIGLPAVMQTQDGDTTEQEQNPEEDWQSLVRLCNGCTMLTWNGNKPGWTQNDAFRKAVRLLLDPVAMQAELGGERVLPAYSLRPEDSNQYERKTASAEEIARELAGSGYDGTELRLVVHEKYERDGRWIAERMNHFGIGVDLFLANWSQVADPAVISSADFTISGIILAEDDVCEIDMYEHDECVSSTYLAASLKGWILEQIDRALSAENAQDRRSHMRDIETRLREEGHIIFLHHRRLNTYLHPSVRGASFNSNGWIDFKHIWLEK